MTVALLASGSHITEHLDAVAALERVPASVLVVYGSRDDTVEWEPLVERARDLEQSVVEFAADHYFVGQHGTVAEAMVSLLAERLA